MLISISNKHREDQNYLFFGNRGEKIDKKNGNTFRGNSLK